MSEIKPVMNVFTGTNGAGKSTLSMQMRDWLASWLIQIRLQDS
ncbi:hypothetical protein ABGV42_31525 [Paenibacillus pabuli]